MPLGTGGAIKNAEKYVDCPVLIFNGDVLTDLDLTDLIKYHKQKKSKATITLVEVDDPTSFGLVETNKNGNILQFLEKPSANQITCNTINAGTYIFEPEILKEIPENTVYSVERGLFPNLLNKKYPFYGFVYSGYWIDIGTMEKYLQVHHDLMNKMKKNSVGNNSKLGKNIKIDGKLLIGDNSAIGDNVIIEGNVCIGNDVIIANHCTLIDCIILDGTKIHEGSKIEKSLIGKNCLLETNSVLSSGCAIGDNTIIRSYSRL